MAGLELSSCEKKNYPAQARYGRVELEKLGRTALVQYYICSSNIPCVRVLGYVLAGRRAGVERIPESHRGIVRRRVMVDTAARYHMDAPLVHFDQ